MNLTLNFLYDIYSKQCEEGDYIILAVKGKTIPWKDIPIRYNAKSIKSKLQRFFEQYPSEDYDLYFSPMPYSNPRRRIVNTLDTKFLVQDVDEVDNPEEINPKPSYLWESSPGKYQGMWELDRYIEENEYTPLNKALAKFIGCDDCFDFVHVYRIPGTINHKYKNKPKVKLPITTKKIYKPKVLKRIVGAVDKPKQSEDKVPINLGADLTERKIYAKYSIPQKVRELLALEDLTGVDRSNIIWYIENKLFELGMSPNEIIYLVKNSLFNKYKGRHDEDIRLKKELEKVISGGITPKGQDDNDISLLKTSTFGEVMGSPEKFEGWLVKGFWGRRSNGIVAGMPKCFKSTLVQDLVISVASGKPFLGKYPVLDPGPVILVQNENADYVMKDRTEKLILHRGLEGHITHKRKDKLNIRFPEELPISFINQQGFMLTNESHKEQLEEMIKETNPVLVVLDPLYLMFDGDLNSAKDLGPVLQWLLYIKNEYKTSVMLIHHYNKGGQGTSRGGQRMMGSIILYGWIESAWYLSKEESDEEETQPADVSVDSKSGAESVVTMNREFRMAGLYPEIDIHLQMGDMGDPSYDVDVTISGHNSTKISSVKDDIVNLLNTSNVPMSRRGITEQLGLSEDKVREALDDLVNNKKIIPSGRGFSVYKYNS